MTEIFLSPLSYPGAKGRALTIIDPIFPNFSEIQEYREPFIGGGSVFLYVRSNYGDRYKDTEYWINDKEPFLYNFWVQVQKHPTDLVNKVKFYLTEYKDCKSLDRFYHNSLSLGKLTDLDKAALYWIKNIASFGGKTHSGMNPVMYEKLLNRMKKDNFENLEKEIDRTSDLLVGVKLTNLDYSKLFNGITKPTFMFLDPPYFTAKTLYGDVSSKFNLHDMFDHYLFAKWVNKVSQDSNIKLMITYDDCQTVRGLYGKIKGLKIIPYTFRYTLGNPIKEGVNGRVGKEVMIINYEPENGISEQKTLFDF